MTGELIPLDILPSSKDRIGITRRFPIGPIAGISPFNFPLNLAAHKIAPAIASGNPIVLKPPSKDPLVMLAVAEIIEAAGVPAGAVSILPMTRELGDRMVADERFKLLTFTGSPSVGWRMKERAGKKKVVLELGGNAGVIVDKSADLDWAVKRNLVGGFAYAGQVCISVQRAFIHEDVWDEFMPRFAAGAEALKVGDPLDPATDVGPMVDEHAASRTQRWVDEAVALGGKVLTGGKANGTFFPPTILTDVPTTAAVCSNEAFAPLVVATRFHELDEAIAMVNDSMFGLQTGVFTNDLSGAWRAFSELEVGGVIVNDVPTYRTDHMPYGGVKDFRARPRGPALGHRGYDRDPDHGPRPTELGAARPPQGGVVGCARSLRTWVRSLSCSPPPCPGTAEPRRRRNGRPRAALSAARARSRTLGCARDPARIQNARPRPGVLGSRMWRRGGQLGATT